ncbi:hypothetical protein DL769_008677 [Monosporascus sp. CRB-8-3]|nr:hypothetical protein DL769_008677 [Monosporascus sp. CRB-8-3]
MPLRKGSQPRKLRLALVASVFVALVLFSRHHSAISPAVPARPSEPATHACQKSPLGDDVLVVLRTGATEALEKLPVHFETILKCVSDYVIYSDMEEDIEGHHVYDVLDQVSDTIKDTMPEFKLYNHIRASGRQGLNYQTVFGSGPSGALENLGWKLDKWKFLPMVDRALQHRPNAKWFVFVESDTYMVWHNMLEYLSRFDASQPHYLGKHMYIGDILFAHGGSGFALSNPALRKVTGYWREHRDEFEQYTEKQWAGDMVLGKALKDVGVDMRWVFPHLQGDSLTAMDWNVSKLSREPWCYAPITFHHMNMVEFNMLWRFEQEWHHRNRGVATLRFRDIFKSLVRPRLQAEREDWDNISIGAEYSDEALARFSDSDVERGGLSPADRAAHLSFDRCRAACESRPLCIQFSYAPGTCSTSNELRLGHAADSQCLEYSNAAGKCIKSGAAEGKGDVSAERKSSVRSGWVMSRVSYYVKNLDQSCDSPEGNDWVM